MILQAGTAENGLLYIQIVLGIGVLLGGAMHVGVTMNQFRSMRRGYRRMRRSIVKLRREFQELRREVRGDHE